MEGGPIMSYYMFFAVTSLFILVFIFDISFNLRRLVKNIDKMWRKLAEISDLLQTK